MRYPPASVRRTASAFDSNPVSFSGKAYMKMTTAVFSAILSFLPVLALASDGVDLTKHPWAKFKPGSWVKIANGFSSASSLMDDETTVVLLAVGERSHKKRFESVSKGHGTSSVESEFPSVDYEPKLTGRETLAIQGIDIVCDVWEFACDKDGCTDQEKTWIAADSGMTVKHEYQKSGKCNWSSFETVVDLADHQVVDGKEIPCWRSEGTQEQPGMCMQKLVTWHSPEIPGFLVRSETHMFGISWALTEEVSIEEAVSFSGKKRDAQVPSAPSNQRSWSNFEVGAWVKRRSECHPCMPTSSTSTVVRTLTAVTDREVVFQTQVTFRDRAMSSSEERRQLDRQNLVTRGKGKAVKEVLVIDGKAYACTVWRGGEGGDAQTRSHETWIHDETGLVLKSRSRSSEEEPINAFGVELRRGADSWTHRLETVKVGEKMRIGQREVSCWVMEETSVSEKVHSRIKKWICTEVPGFVVRQEAFDRQNNMDTIRLEEVVDFGAK